MDNPDNDFSDNLQFVARTDVGMRRANNQDSYSIVLAENDQAWRDRGHLFVVADGMGAHAAGELASKLAADGIGHLYSHYRDLPPSDALSRAILETNAEIHRRGKANPEFHAMGTTASTLVLSPRGALVGHVGDSRVYRLRADCLHQLTFDHSLQWELRALGRLEDGSDLARNVPKNVITRSLGPNANVVVDLEGPFPLEVGDTFLLCSDGLSGKVEDEEMGQILASLPPEEAADTLVDLANLRGGPDNITLIIVKVVHENALLVSDTRQTGGSPSAGEPKAKQNSTSGSTAWVVAGVCLFLALVLWFAEQPAPAIASAVAAGLAVIFGLIARFRQPPTTDTGAAAGQMLGHGPHSQTTCPSGDAFVRSLSSILDQLREAAKERHWDVDWDEFRRLDKSAADATEAKHYPQAIRSYSIAIRFMMQTLRKQPKVDTDSSVEY